MTEAPVRAPAARRKSVSLAQRFAVAVRVATAVVAAYGLGVGLGGCFAIACLRLGASPAASGQAGMLASFVFGAAVVIWVFAARSLIRMAVGLAIPLGLVLLVWILGGPA